MTIERIKSGINKAEDAGTQTNQIHRCVAADLPNGAGQFPISRLDQPGDLVRPKFSNI